MQVIKSVILFFALIVAIIILFVGVFFLSQVNNDKLLKSFSAQLENYQVPQNTVIIDNKSLCGKLNGNGDGMDFFACVLVKSELELTEVQKHYKTATFNTVKRWSKNIVHCKVYAIDNASVSIDLLERENLTFEKLYDLQDLSGYYVVTIYDGGYWAGLDLRGC